MGRGVTVGFFQLHQYHAAAVRGTAFDDADGLVAETGVEQQAASVTRRVAIGRNCETGDFPIQFHHGAFVPLADGGGELADVERPDGLRVAEEQFIDVLREADHVTEVGGRGRAVLQVCVQAG